MLIFQMVYMDHIIWSICVNPRQNAIVSSGNPLSSIKVSSKINGPHVLPIAIHKLCDHSKKIEEIRSRNGNIINSYTQS